LRLSLKKLLAKNTIIPTTPQKVKSKSKQTGKIYFVGLPMMARASFPLPPFQIRCSLFLLDGIPFWPVVHEREVLLFHDPRAATAAISLE
tara:strand:+ start:262 stop:531 length:270 start_codon:yes stop_codon:yes gene_type:complete